MFVAWAFCANEYVKEEKEKITTFSTRGYLLNNMLYNNNIQKVVLYRKVVFSKVTFKSLFKVSVLLELVVHVNNSR